MANTFDDGYRAGYQAGYKFCEDNNRREILDLRPAAHGMTSSGPDWVMGWNQGLAAGCADLNKKRDGFDVLVDVSPAWASPNVQVTPLRDMSSLPKPASESNSAWWIAGAAAALGLGTWLLISKGRGK